MKRVGEIKGVPVMTSPFVDKDSIYLVNPNRMNVIVKNVDFRPTILRTKIKYYFKNLWKALRGKSV